MSKIVCKIVSTVVSYLHLFYCQGPLLYLSLISQQRIYKNSQETYCICFLDLSFFKSFTVFLLFICTSFKKGFFGSFLFMYVIQHCFIRRLSDSTESADAGIKPRTVATLALTARSSNHICKYKVYLYNMYCTIH
jgi:hypothetical protein